MAVRVALQSMLGVAFALHGGCRTTAWRGELRSPETVSERDVKDAPYLKVHLNDGRVYVLRDWHLDPKQQVVSGTGVVYDVDRAHHSEIARRTIGYQAIAILETNRPETVTHSGLVVIGVVAGLSLAVTALCLSSPKTCFGSCPTFYAPEHGALTLQAEGFSASIARALEATDVDPLYATEHPGGVLELQMRNEALETHAVRSVRVLSAPRPVGGRVLHAGDAFYGVRGFAPPTSCQSLLGECVEALRAVDDHAYLSPTDGQDLGAKETVELSFAAQDGAAGLVIVGRMGLLTTFLLYQALAYLGHDATETLLRLEHGGTEVLDMARSTHALLGGVEVEVQTADGGWAPAGAFYEMGPLAREAQLVLLPSNRAQGDVRVRLRMTRGNWKLDQVALVRVEAPVTPSVHPLKEALRDGRVDAEATARLLDPDQHLLTFPGDQYVLRFELPEGPRELFLESTGYYYEWMRTQWLPEQDPAAALGFVLDPQGTLRRLAPAYKRIEPQIEELFWQSRIGQRP